MEEPNAAAFENVAKRQRLSNGGAPGHFDVLPPVSSSDPSASSTDEVPAVPAQYPGRRERKNKWGPDEEEEAQGQVPPPPPPPPGGAAGGGLSNADFANMLKAGLLNDDGRAPPAGPGTFSSGPMGAPMGGPGGGGNFSKNPNLAPLGGGGGGLPPLPQPASHDVSAVQDPNINPWTRQPYSKRYWDILAKREKLPCAAAKKQFLKLVQKNQVTVLVGETGSGKTTQMPQFVLDAGYAAEGKFVACTQPRRVAAMSVAARVADEMDVQLGTFCGYSIRFEDQTGPQTVLKYMTDGMLLREAMTDPTLGRYAVIILDEAHERTLATDVLFGLLKKIMQTRTDLKIVVMSATLDAEKMQKYFNNAPMINVPGRTHPVDVYYTPEAEKDYLQASIRTVLMIHQEEAEGDILLFLTGEEEIEYACKALMQGARGFPDGGELMAVPLYSSLPPHMQQKIFEKAPGPRWAGGPAGRKVVVSTNIAETSVTIDGIVYVVDPGLSKQKVFNPRIKLESLLVSPISQASAAQRVGRAGRTRPGKCYRLFTEVSFKEILPAQTYPEILRSNLSNTVLTLLKLGIQDLVHFDFLDPPAPETLMHALSHLRYLGALNEEMCLTNIGKMMSEFPLDPNLSALVINSGKFKCSQQMLTIAAMLSVPQPFVRGKKEEKDAADQAKKRFASMDGDHFQLLNAYEAFLLNTRDSYDSPERYCVENFLNLRSLTSAESVRTQLKSIMERLALPLTSSPKSDPNYHQNMLKALTAGYFTNVARFESEGKHKDMYLIVKDGSPTSVHPSCCLQHKPDWVVYHEVVLTTKNFLRICTKIKPEWLLEVNKEYFLSAELPMSGAKRELRDLAEKMESEAAALKLL